MATGTFYRCFGFGFETAIAPRLFKLVKYVALDTSVRKSEEKWVSRVMSSPCI